MKAFGVTFDELKSLQRKGDAPTFRCTCKNASCSTEYRINWGPKVGPYLSKVSDQGGTSCGMTIQHLSCQRLLCDHLNDGGKLCVQTVCSNKNCQEVLCSREFELNAGQAAEMETTFVLASDKSMRSADVAILDASRNIIFIMEVLHTHATDERHRQGYSWCEVSTKELLAGTEEGKWFCMHSESNTITVTCKREHTMTCDACKEKKLSQKRQWQDDQLALKNMQGNRRCECGKTAKRARQVVAGHMRTVETCGNDGKCDMIRMLPLCLCGNPCSVLVAKNKKNEGRKYFFCVKCKRFVSWYV